jgi:hypothetical protein
MKNKNKNNTQRQAHPRRKQSPKQSKTFSPLDGASCSASSILDGMVVGMIKFYDDGTYDAYGRIDQTICSLLRNQAQSTNTSSVE